MSTHILVIGVDSSIRKLLDEGYLMFPEHLDDRDYDILCPYPEHCHGWMECRRQHICPHGHTAPARFDDMSLDGPCPGRDDNCFAGDDEEFTFHGEHHTYRYGWGWTVEWPGCVVQGNDWSYDDVPYERMPRGEYDVYDDWDDDSCHLQLVAEHT